MLSTLENFKTSIFVQYLQFFQTEINPACAQRSQWDMIFSINNKKIEGKKGLWGLSSHSQLVDETSMLNSSY